MIMKKLAIAMMLKCFCLGNFSSSKLQSTDRLPSARCETL